MGDRQVYIYALCEPDGETVRYVGKTLNPHKRYREHTNVVTLRKRNLHKNNWVLSLLSRGEHPIMRELEIVEPGGDWRQAECKWITYYLSLGFVLTNHALGGGGTSGYKHSEETKRKIGEGNRGKRRTPEQRLALSASHAGKPRPWQRKKKTDEARARMSAAQKLRRERERRLNVRDTG